MIKFKLVMAMKSSPIICSVVAFFGVLIHALPPIEARHYTPSVGESCDFEGVSGSLLPGFGI